MPKDVTPPPAQPQYEGYRWLGSQWGRSGKPTPARIRGSLMLVAATPVFIVAVNSTGADGRPAAVLAGAVAGTACLVAAVLYFVDAHFAARAANEQQPVTPSLDA